MTKHEINEALYKMASDKLKDELSGRSFTIAQYAIAFANWYNYRAIRGVEDFDFYLDENDHNGINANDVYDELHQIIIDYYNDYLEVRQIENLDFENAKLSTLLDLLDISIIWELLEEEGE